MCEVCRRIPCHPQCPNAPEPAEVYECEVCGDPICEGEYVYRLGDLTYCAECVKNGKEEVALDDYE